MNELKKYRVKALVHAGEDEKGKARVFEQGAVVELDDETAKASPWAFEEVQMPGAGEQVPEKP